MKKLLSVVLLAGSLQAMAYNWFSVQTHCSVNRAQAHCTVYNRWYTPIQCQINANGITSYGYYLNLSRFVTVFPGMHQGVYVSASNPYLDPLYQANAQAYCRF